MRAPPRAIAQLPAALHAERIVVLDQGSFVLHGTHAELLTGRQAYADLVGPQLHSPLAELG